MARKRHTAEQIIHKLREGEVALGQGKSVKAVCKQLEITEQTYYRWRKEYGGLRLDQAEEPHSQRSGWYSQLAAKPPVNPGLHWTSLDFSGMSATR